ncbi:hypothetical protein GGR57DRAFT_497778 [Xylariaceae sp. FL1272]|nr:hypothetical protein GGR57DRAFT_497778 [Xylariaceae sp. FL1272]
MTKVQIFASPPEALIARLRSHIPYSLPLIRRLRFAGFPGGSTEHTKILWVSSVAVEYAKGGAGDNPFAAGYLDFSRGPETELWIYSSLEHRVGTNPNTDSTDETGGTEDDEEIACALVLLREVKNQQDVYFATGSVRAQERPYPTMLIGNLGENLRLRLAEKVVFTYTGVYDKWVFDVEVLPDAKLHEEGEKKGWVWDTVREHDLPFMLSRTDILRTPQTMKLLPSTALYASDGTPIAWAFLGPDSSLSSLHCEEPYRGRGIAKAVAVKIFRDHLRDYGVEGANMGWADVDPLNVPSQAVCTGLKAEVKWQISWSRLDLNLSFRD